MTVLLLFGSSFLLVFMLGLQSLSVNGGHKYAAFANSFLIGVLNITLLKIAPQAEGLEIAAYVLGGPFGIVASMSFFRWFRSNAKTRSALENLESK